MLNICTIPDNVVEQFWNLESIGVRDIDTGECPVWQKFNENVNFNEASDRYEVGLIWRENHPPLLDNKHIAFSSMKRLDRRLDRDPTLKDAYNGALQEMENLGYIEEVQGMKCKADFPVFYLPHHPVLKESSTSTKVRPVFNASCKGANGVSLNDCLEAGPNLNPSVVDVLLRFRRWRFAVTADVRKVFLQIEMKEEDQEVQRFLWKLGENVRVMKFNRVLTVLHFC